MPGAADALRGLRASRATGAADRGPNRRDQAHYSPSGCPVHGASNRCASSRRHREQASPQPSCQSVSDGRERLTVHHDGAWHGHHWSGGE